ncbi:hypothetical protein TNCT_452671 [Trichonephila clavata]|uniref:Uncharacterized protein n=1 Tax=Trichonephila clavata TaxID=2740835 RepID=A0A8X6HR82_TRICU|nr:hypothetical protein TNCT_452671 [Trichonephila clavata]
MRSLFVVLLLVAFVACASAQYYYPGYYGAGLSYPYAAAYNGVYGDTRPDKIDTLTFGNWNHYHQKKYFCFSIFNHLV